MKVDILGLLQSPKLAGRVFEEATDLELTKLAEMIALAISSGHFPNVKHHLERLREAIIAKQQSR